MIRSAVRLGTFRRPNQPEPPPAPDPAAPLTVGDVIDAYVKGHVPRLEDGRPRREAAQRAMRWSLGVIRRTEIPAAHGQTITFESKAIRDVARADVEAIRAARQRVHAEAVAAREQWTQTKTDQPIPRILAGAKGGAIGINRLLERLRHFFVGGRGRLRRLDAFPPERRRRGEAQSQSRESA